MEFRIRILKDYEANTDGFAIMPQQLTPIERTELIKQLSKSNQGNCTHCGGEGRVILLVSEPVSLCLDCAGKFITKGMPILEKQFEKLIIQMGVKK